MRPVLLKLLLEGISFVFSSLQDCYILFAKQKATSNCRLILDICINHLSSMVFSYIL